MADRRLRRAFSEAFKAEALKVELDHGAAVPTRAAARRAVFDYYIELFYNTRRRHSTSAI